MDLKERVYSVLLVCSSEKLNTAFSELLSGPRYERVKTVTNVSAARRAHADKAYDMIIVNAPLPDDTGIRFAIDAAASKGAVVLLLVRSEAYDDIFERVVEHGVFMLSRPVSHQTLTTALGWMESARERSRSLEEKSLSVEEKMQEIRIVNRAKWMLISEKGLDEPQAHRYIEKLAMDRCISKREAAEDILNGQGTLPPVH